MKETFKNAASSFSIGQAMDYNEHLGIVDEAIEALKINDDLWDKGILSAMKDGVHCVNEVFLQAVKEHNVDYSIKQRASDDLLRFEAEINGTVFFTLVSEEKRDQILAKLS